MPNYRRANLKGGTYFFTVVTFKRQKILCNADVRTALREAIQSTQAVHPFNIDAWVLLPNHLHCIWTLPEDDANFSTRWAMIKRHVSQKCGPKYRRDGWVTRSINQRNESTIWQRRFWEHQIRDDRDYEKHMDYLHYNPVKHNHVTQVIDWPYSTFHRLVRQGVYKENWADKTVDEVDGKFGE